MHNDVDLKDLGDVNRGEKVGELTCEITIAWIPIGNQFEKVQLMKIFNLQNFTFRWSQQKCHAIIQRKDLEKDFIDFILKEFDTDRNGVLDKPEINSFSAFQFGDRLHSSHALLPSFPFVLDSTLR